MEKTFCFNTFTSWVQDTQDYRGIKSAEKYIERKVNDCIKYCTEVLNLSHHEAYKYADYLAQSEKKRLGM